MSPKLSFLLFAAVAFAVTALAAEVPKVSPTEAATLVRQGAVLIDVREPAEWKQTGVAEPAVLLEKSDFDGAKTVWTPFLEKTGKDKPLIVYCRSGRRSAIVAEALAAQGYKVFNAGGLIDWTNAGLPVRQVEQR